MNRLEHMAAGRPYCLVSSIEEAEIAVDLALADTEVTRSPLPV